MTIQFSLTLLLIFVLLDSRAESQTRTKEPISPIEAPDFVDKAKVDLGKMLFFDKRLSSSNNISCGDCHNVMLGGTDNLKSSIGDNWQKGPINSPTVFNAKYNIAQFWNGRAKDLKEQAGGPIENPMEMAFSHEGVERVLNTIPGYKAAFKKAFGSDQITIAMVTESIAAFEETLVTPNSPFDRWLKGDENAISSTAKQGYSLFKGLACVSCHNGPAVGGNSFQKFGVVKPYPTKNLGRYDVTKKQEDRFVFKVPTLRNIELTYPYFHDGDVWSLEEAVKIMAEYQLGQKLGDDDIEKIVAFLKTLTGERPNFRIPELPPSTLETMEVLRLAKSQQDMNRL